MSEAAKSVYYGPGNVGEAVVYQSDAPNIFSLLDKEIERKDKAKEDQKIKDQGLGDA